jgi:hypothetical protein
MLAPTLLASSDAWKLNHQLHVDTSCYVSCTLITYTILTWDTTLTLLLLLSHIPNCWRPAHANSYSKFGCFYTDVIAPTTTRLPAHMLHITQRTWHRALPRTHPTTSATLATAPPASIPRPLRVTRQNRIGVVVDDAFITEGNRSKQYSLNPRTSYYRITRDYLALDKFTMRQCTRIIIHNR